MGVQPVLIARLVILLDLLFDCTKAPVAIWTLISKVLEDMQKMPVKSSLRVCCASFSRVLAIVGSVSELLWVSCGSWVGC